MKRTFLLISCSFLLFIAVVVNTAWIQEPTIDNTNRLERAKKSYLTDIKAFQKAINDFNSNHPYKNTEALRSDFLKIRTLYKTIEALAAYFDPEYVKDYINGAPLRSLERKADDGVTILEPEGLQILEEEIFAEQPDQKKIAELSLNLSKSLDTFLKYQSSILFTDRHLFEASRFELIRIFSMGLSGFDSPSTSQVIEEQATAISSISEIFSHYQSLLSNRDKNLYIKISNTFNQASDYLRGNNDFDSFDRMYFLRTYINPLYSDVLKAQRLLGVETYYETSPLHQKHPVNYFAETIFDEDFLNTNYFTRYAAEDYNENVVKLGQILFFDPILSQNNKRSCASCHNPEKAFTDGKKKSLAFNMEGTVERNSPTLINAVFSERFFYDMRVDVLDDQIEHVVVDHDEFRSSFLALFKKLSKSDEYVGLFRDAFPKLKDDPIKKYTISAALAAYVASLKRLNSPFDKYARGETNTIDKEVIDGFNLFYGKAACGTCHFAPVFNGLVPPHYNESESEVLGVAATAANKTMDTDLGRAAGKVKEESEIYQNSFKTVSVRNVEHTAPYMHNGAYETLEQVLDFYNRGGGLGLGFEVNNQTLPGDPLDLTQKEQNQIITFMKSLSDIESAPKVPTRLPIFANNEKLNKRKIGGEY